MPLDWSNLLYLGCQMWKLQERERENIVKCCTALMNYAISLHGFSCDVAKGRILRGLGVKSSRLEGFMHRQGGVSELISSLSGYKGTVDTSVLIAILKCNLEESWQIALPEFCDGVTITKVKLHILERELNKQSWKNSEVTLLLSRILNSLPLICRSDMSYADSWFKMATLTGIQGTSELPLEIKFTRSQFTWLHALITQGTATVHQQPDSHQHS